MRIPVIGQSFESFSKDIDVQRTVNWYVESSPSGKNNTSLIPTPGLKSFGTSGAGAHRSAIVADGLLYVISGNTLYSVDTGGLSTSRGTINTSSGSVEMAYNGTQIMIVDGTNGYTYTIATTTLAVIADADYPDVATTVAFIDSYFVVNDPANTNADGAPGAFFISSNYDGTAWSALDFAVAGRSWDQIEAIRVANGQLWLVGEESTEVFINTGNADFPFERSPSAVIEWGTSAGASVVEAQNQLLWLSKTKYGQGVVVMTNGYNVQPISHGGINEAIAGYSTVSDAFGYTYQWKGHIFYVLTFPTANKTWVYDVSTGTWIEWSTNGTENRHDSNSYAFFNGKHLVGDRDSGSIYELNDATYDDDGTAITRLRQTPHIHAEDKRLYARKLNLQFEQGIATGSVPDPQAMLQWSDDGGHTWSNEYWRDILGETGQYSLPSQWRRLGSFRDRVFRIKITDAVKAVLIDGYLDVSGGEDKH